MTKNAEIKHIAKLLAYNGYRNGTPIEDIHAGTWPKNAKGEYADDSEVVVTTLDGGEQIPWAECSRIHDSEMKELNKAVANNIYSILCLLDEFGDLSRLMQPHNWDEPEHTNWYKAVRKRLKASATSRPPSPR